MSHVSNIGFMLILLGYNIPFHLKCALMILMTNNNLTKSLIYQESKIKTVPTLIILFCIFLPICWFFLHLAQQGESWAYGVPILLVCGYFYFFWLLFYVGFSLTLSEKGIKYVTAKAKPVEIPWSYIETIQPHYKSFWNGQSSLLPNGIEIILKDQFRTRPKPKLSAYDYNITGPYKGIFIMDLVGVMKEWHSRYTE